jgi:hypothetical protein
MQADRDTFIVSKQSTAGNVGTSSDVKADVYQAANEHCAKTGRAVETVSIDVLDAIPNMRAGNALLQFKCVPRP